MPNSTSYNPYSHYYQAHTLSDRLALVRHDGMPRQACGTTLRRSSHFDPPFVSSMDMIDVLGGFDAMAGPYGTTIGHTGCVNALAWSQSGDHLASGSDDQRVILWKMGATDEAPSIEFPVAGIPRLGLAQSEVIETGHRANIFSVKWAPNSGDRRLFTCAGDSQMRVFDLTRASASVERKQTVGTGFKVWPQDQGACIRVLRCHAGRAKRISTENSPDVFLSCAEDGDVRQTDLRLPHTCARSRDYGEGCPRPLVQFQMELYSLSVSKQEPWLFAVAGTSDKVFLMDRRMVPRLLKREWGSTVPSETAALTHCVRLFEREPAEEDRQDSLDGRQTRAHTAAAQIRSRCQDRAHVTAVKISEHNGRDMVASYSGDDVYKFDIHRAPGLRKTVSKTISMETESSKRLRASSDRSSPSPAIVQEDARVVEARNRIAVSLFSRGGYSRSTHLVAQFARRQQVLDDIEVVHQAALDQQTRFCVVLCSLLVCLEDATYDTDPEFRDNRSDILECNRALAEFRGVPIALGIQSLLGEYMEADYTEAEHERYRARRALFACGAKIIRQQWPVAAAAADAAAETAAEANADASTRPDPYSSGMEYHMWAARHESQEEVLATLRHFAEFGTVPTDESEGEASAEDDEEHGSVSNGEEADEVESDSPDIHNTEDDDESDGDENDDIQRHHLSGGNDAPRVFPVASFSGHVNIETVKDCGFVGSNDEYVWSGSDCGHLFMWHNDPRSELCGIWKADDSVVNVLAQHPTLPVCAVSGIDDTVKIFGPRSAQTSHELRYSRFGDRDNILRRNATRAEAGQPGIGARSLLRLFARRAAHGDLERMAVDGEEQDCVIA